MEIPPNYFCITCNKKIPYYIGKTNERITNANGIEFSYTETKALCPECGNQIYISGINDSNILARNRAYYSRLLNSKEAPVDGSY